MTRIAFVLAVATVTASVGEAQSLSFDRLALQLDQGDRITVTDREGRELEGRIVGLSSSTLSLQAGGLRHDLTGGDVSVIRRQARDSLKNGAMIGFLSGAAFAVGLVAGSECSNAGLTLYAASLFGGAGAAIGVGVDALHQGSQVVYSAAPPTRRFAVSPVVSRGSRGLSVSLGF